MSRTRAIDLFAGWGGMSLGAEQAGVRVVWAANHWQLAVDAHAAAIPGAEHVCQDLRQADWSALPAYDLLLAAPACQGHSTASQPCRRPYHDAMRATAWAVVDCAEVTRPQAIIVENVPAFARWQLYPLWRQALEVLGYHVDELLVRASHHGVPQRRDRLFVVGRRSGGSLSLAPSSTEPPIGPCIEWDRGAWRPLESAAPGAYARLQSAQARAGARCVVQHVSRGGVVRLDEPIRTITGQDQWAVVDGDRYRPLTVRETARAMGFPDSYGWPASAGRRDTIRGLGNAVCPPVARDVVMAVLEAA